MNKLNQSKRVRAPTLRTFISVLFIEDQFRDWNNSNSWRNFSSHLNPVPTLMRLGAR